MYNLAILICLYAGTLVCITGTTYTRTEMADDNYPPEQQKIIDHILTAKKPEQRSDTKKGYRQLFSLVDGAGLQRLQSHPDDNIALQAAWQEVELTIPAEMQPDPVRPDREKLEWFIGFMEKRCRLQAPEWWKVLILDAVAYKRHEVGLNRSRDNPYHDAGVPRLRAPRGTTLSRTQDKLILRIGTDSIAIPETLFKKSIQGELMENLSALMTPTVATLFFMMASDHHAK